MDDVERLADDLSRRYAGFLAYSRENREMAVAVQNGLQHFAKEWYRLRALRIFRDDATLGAAPDVWRSIRTALDQSGHLILLASPEAARSNSVTMEVEYWLNYRRATDILIIVAGGDIDWSDDEGDFDRQETTCIPAALYGAFENEPLWVDLRDLSTDQLDLRAPDFKDRIASIAAPLHNTSKDDLIGTHVRLYRRARVLAWSAVAVLTCLAVVAGGTAIVAMQQRKTAQIERNTALVQRRSAIARQLMAQAQLTLDRDPDTALKLNLAAHTLLPGAETRAALFANLTATGYAGTLPQPQPASDGTFFSTVEAVGFSPDGKTLAMGILGRVLVWHRDDSGKPWRSEQVIHTHSVATTSVAFAPKGLRLAIGTSTGQVSLWDLSAGDPRKLSEPLAGDGFTEVSSLAFTPDGATLVSSGAATLLWDVADPVRPRRISDSLTAGRAGVALALSGDGRTLAVVVGGQPTRVVLWNVADRFHPRRIGPVITDHVEGGRAIALSRDGRMLATSGGDFSIGLWNIGRPDQPRRFGPLMLGHSNWIAAMVFSEDRQRLITGAADRTVIMWDITNPVHPQRLGPSLGRHPGPVLSLALSQDETMLAIGDFYSTTMWDLRNRGEPASAPTGLVATDAPLFAPSGTLMAVAADHDIALVDAASGHPLRVVSTLARPIGASASQPLAFTEGGAKLLVSAQLDAEAVPTTALEQWDVSDPSRPARVGGAITVPGRGEMFLSPGGGLVAIVTAEGANLWDVSDPSRPVTGSDPLTGHVTLIRAVAFAPGGQIAATASDDGSVLIWNVTDWKHPRQIGPRLIGYRDGVSDLAFTPDGNTLVSGSFDNTIILWDISNPHQPRRLGQPLVANNFGVTKISLTLDGRTLATYGWDGAVALWDITDLTQPHRIGQPLHPATGLRGMTFTPDGRRLLLVQGDGKITAWDLAPITELRDDSVKHACQFTNGGLNAVEWARYVQLLAYEHTCVS